MSISSTVAELARALDKHVRENTDADPRLLARLEQLADMPTYVETARLDQWEELLVPARAEAEISPEFAAMVAILELSLINIYGEIDPELTAEYAKNAVTAMRATGMTVSDAETFALADW